MREQVGNPLNQQFIAEVIVDADDLDIWMFGGTKLKMLG
jgi:hypothetical protein